MDTPILHMSLAVEDLPKACSFYESVFGCTLGRSGSDWRDVWFFGMQLTLQLRPDEVVRPEHQGVRHFGVVLPDEDAWRQVLDRADAYGARWLSPPTLSHDPTLSGKLGGKLVDPSGNVVEVKCYPDPTTFLSGRPRSFPAP